MSPIRHRHLDVDGVRVFYRETVPDAPDADSVPDRGEAPPLLLLHGFPSGSHQFRSLMDALGGRYRLIAPDYPGFGRTQAPDGLGCRFDWLADVMEGFVTRLGLPPFAMYVFDYGAPVGFRLALRHPEWIAGIVAQNGNAYAEGLSDWFSEHIALDPADPGAVAALRSRLTLERTRLMHLAGAAEPDLIDPDIWTLDQHFLDQPGHKDVVIALTFDYRSNVEQYPAWQDWLRKYSPPTLVIWGKHDPIFLEAGAHAYLRDVPDAEVQILNAGHFALEARLTEITPLIARFLDRLEPAPASR
jgi:pimeloyl-ACP methyl ester carboxylesterase